VAVAWSLDTAKCRKISEELILKWCRSTSQKPDTNVTKEIPSFGKRSE